MVTNKLNSKDLGNTHALKLYLNLHYTFYTLPHLLF